MSHLYVILRPLWLSISCGEDPEADRKWLREEMLQQVHKKRKSCISFPSLLLKVYITHVRARNVYKIIFLLTPVESRRSFLVLILWLIQCMEAHDGHRSTIIYSTLCRYPSGREKIGALGCQKIPSAFTSPSDSSCKITPPGFGGSVVI